MTLKDGEGNIYWKVSKTEGLIDLVAIETSVVNGLKEQAGVRADSSRLQAPDFRLQDSRLQAPGFGERSL